ncbi:hypothetical protein IQ260_15225 [Leptolyngbya cf. ectocarpi LEGE 11479]|uniref:Uncharacterized protein n=1 Tax=Leptolyngbya cf. ectocarpi LEGE 11479 TaxID=1828722 RepID=A0A929F728_LEPEC|nr:hypothetical protein [Leptolyngbya ectocarpi]MBE9068001.1 hypothetical protein [Leptolyngbya cf. ectocarpi LEGE 11479]
MTQTSVTTSCSSIPKILRYLEWIFLGIPTLRALFPILYKPLGYVVTISRFKQRLS